MGAVQTSLYLFVRPFNCVGIGEKRALTDKDVFSGNIKLAMSPVPDIVQKVLKGQNPLHILGDGSQVRHYTYGADLARDGLCIEDEKALNNDFNISTAESTTVLELAEMWEKIYKGKKPFKYTSDKPFQHDVKKRVPDVSKAKEVLGFEATTQLSDMLNEVIPWIK